MVMPGTVTALTLATLKPRVSFLRSLGKSEALGTLATSQSPNFTRLKRAAVHESHASTLSCHVGIFVTPSAPGSSRPDTFTAKLCEGTRAHRRKPRSVRCSVHTPTSCFLHPRLGAAVRGQSVLSGREGAAPPMPADSITEGPPPRLTKSSTSASAL